MAYGNNTLLEKIPVPDLQLTYVQNRGLRITVMIIMSAKRAQNPSCVQPCSLFAESQNTRAENTVNTRAEL